MRSARRTVPALFSCLAVVLLASSSLLAMPVTMDASSASGLGASATFSLSADGTTLTIVLTNTSTGVPDGFDESDSLLTSVSFDLPDGVDIEGGSVVITDGSVSENFDAVDSQLSGGDPVTYEWGFANDDTSDTALRPDYVSAMRSHTEPFIEQNSRDANLDGPHTNLNGPQGGLTNGIVELNGNGAVNNSVTITLDLSAPLPDLGFLTEAGVTFEFGSDAAFLTVVPEPSTFVLALLGLAGGLGLVRRRRQTVA